MSSGWTDRRAIDLHVHVSVGAEGGAGFVTPARLLEVSARRGIDAVVLSPWMADLRRALDRGRSREQCQRDNDALAETVGSFPGQVQALGALPLEDCDQAVKTLEELSASGLLGASIPPQVQGTWLGDPFFQPLWEAAEDLGSLLFVHPSTHGLGMDVLQDGFLWNAIGNPVETAIGAAHLVMAGVLERHPALRVLLAHGGGALPAVIGRLERAWRRQKAGTLLVSGPTASFRRFLFDSVVHSPSTLAALVSEVGADRVVLGSDFPFEMGSDDPVAELRAAGLSPADEGLIASGNAVALLAARST